MADADAAQLTASVLERCAAAGFARSGVTEAEPTAYSAALRDWIANGQHGEMGYIERALETLEDPAALLPGARSIICVADRYHDGRRDAPASPTFGRVARYARGGDYHKVIRKRLHTLADDLREHYPGHDFRSCVDTAPLLEREYAARAGIGAIGKHTLVIERGIGSWLLLGEIVTTLPLAVTAAAAPDPCGTCTRCIDACPTDAITPFAVDATKCISYLTIEHRSAVAPDLAGKLGDWLFGCDICQEVCPHGRRTRRSRKVPVHEAYAERRTGFDLLGVLDWDEDARREAIAGTALKRARLEMFKRNAILLLVERAPEDERLRRALARLVSDPDEHELVRETARDALARISGA